MLQSPELQEQYRRMLAEAKPMDTPKLAGQFRKLGEFGEIVMAGRDLGERGVEFVTWLRNVEGNGVCGGRYTLDLAEAERDFMLRSGLLDEMPDKAAVKACHTRSFLVRRIGASGI